MTMQGKTPQVFYQSKTTGICQLLEIRLLFQLQIVLFPYQCIQLVSFTLVNSS